MPDFEILTKLAVDAAIAGGKEIMEVYGSEDFNVALKDDWSPLTQADINSNESITKHLSVSGFPVLSEEEQNIRYDERKNWDIFWLVDPLDGTKEFIKRNGEFTVNIALIKDKSPVIGVIYAPDYGNLYFSLSGSGSYRISGITSAIKEVGDLKSLINTAEKLPVTTKKDIIKCIGSRSHLSLKTKKYLKKIKRRHKNLEIITIGSSLKLCLIAEGNADIYPRLAPTMEWDIAAGHAIVEGAGFSIYEYRTNNRLVYNKKNLKNPFFITGNQQIIDQV
jgi:3'(2'), 5'-bisphosphate nucleotidase